MGPGKRFSASLNPGDESGPVVMSALAFAGEFAAEFHLSHGDCARLAVVVEELVSNALRHGSSGGAIELQLTLAADPRGVAVAIADDGLAFDPTRDRGFAGPDPVTGGGVGLALVQAWSDDFSYERAGERNCVRLTLRPTKLDADCS